MANAASPGPLSLPHLPTTSLPAPHSHTHPSPFFSPHLTQVIHHDSLQPLFGDTLPIDSDGTEILGDDDADACLCDAQSGLKEDDHSAAFASMEDAPRRRGSLHVAHAAEPDRDVSEALEFDTLKCDSDASTECENTPFIETEAVDSPSPFSHHPESRNEGVITPDVGCHDDIDSCKATEDNVLTINMAKADSRVRSTDKNSLHLSASGSKVKSIASVRAASLRASGLRAARQNAMGGTFGNNGSTNDTVTTTNQTSKAVNNEFGIFKFVVTERVHDTSEAGDISVIQTPENTGIVHDNRFARSPCLSTSRPKPQATKAGESKAPSRQLDNQKARKLIFDFEDASHSFSSSKPENGKGKLECLPFGKEPVLNSSILEQQNSLPSGIHAVSTNFTYVESQEPGEESQMNALNVVDKLICLDSTCTSQKPTRHTEPELSAVEGHQGTSCLKSLAQAAQMNVVHGKIGVYDWIDSQPDEGLPVPVTEVYNECTHHDNRLEASKLTTSKKKQRNSAKTGQPSMNMKNSEGILEMKINSNDVVICSSTVMPGKMPNPEHPSLDEDGKIHAFTEHLKNRSRIELPSCTKKSDAYINAKSQSRKRAADKSVCLSARLAQKCQRTDTVIVKDHDETTVTEHVGHKESDLGSIIQNDKEKPLTSNLKPVSKNSRKRSFSIEEARKDLKRSKMEKSKNASISNGVLDNSVKRNGKSIEKLNLEEDMDARKGPRTRSKAQDVKSKLQNSIAAGGKSIARVTRGRNVQKNLHQSDVTRSSTEPHSEFDARKLVDEEGGPKIMNSSIVTNQFADSSFQKNEQEDGGIGNSETEMPTEEMPLVMHKKKWKSMSKCGNELLKHQRLQTKSFLPNTRSHQSDRIRNAHIDVPIPRELRNGRQKSTVRGEKSGVLFESKEQIKAKKINLVNGKVPAAQASEVKSSSRRNEKYALCQSVSNLDDCVSLERRRQKRNPSSIHVLFSHSLPEETTKQQKKILTKLGGHLATSVINCTHFISNSFVRTRNMLVSMAGGKVIATTHWLECCSQAHYFVDEKNYILQDNKKEKELGFSMHSSLAAARRKPLLKGMHIVVTPNAASDHEALEEIIESAGGKIVQKDSDILKSDASMENKLVIGNDKDYEYSLQFLERGFKVYTTELIFHGIVTQNLDFSRNQIFTAPTRRNTRNGGKSNVTYKC